MAASSTSQAATQVKTTRLVSAALPASSELNSSPKTVLKLFWLVLVLVGQQSATNRRSKYKRPVEHNDSTGLLYLAYQLILEPVERKYASTASAAARSGELPLYV